VGDKTQGGRSEKTFGEKKTLKKSKVIIGATVE
jgi:hypothetical protein